MKTTRYALVGVAVASLTIAGTFIQHAKAEKEADAAVYAPQQGITHRFGSKLAVGYFAQENGQCALNLFVTENADDATAPSATRIKLAVKPGDKAELDSVEGESVEVKCGAGAATVEVRPAKLQAAAYVTQ